MASVATGNLINNGCTLHPSRDHIDWVGLQGEVEVSTLENRRAYMVRVRVREISNYELNHTAKGILTIKVNNTQICSVNSGSLTLGYELGVHYSNWTEWFSAEFPATSRPANFNVSAELDLYNVIGSVTGQIGGPDYVSRPGEHFRFLYSSGSIDITGIPDPHTHISVKDIIVKHTTATTISVQVPSIASITNDNSYGVYCDGYWKFGSNIVFTNFNKGSTHIFKSGVKCSCDEWFYANNIGVKTWDIKASLIKATTKTLKFTAKHYAGTNGNNNEYIICQLKDNNNNIIQTKNIISGSEVSFNNLKSNTNYKCTFITNNIPDNNCIVTGKTLIPFNIVSTNCNSSSKTICASIEYEINDSTGIKCIIKCDDVVKELNKTSRSIGFINLNPGNEYNIEYSISDDEGNIITLQKQCTTKMCYITDAISSTQSIKFNINSNSIVEYKVCNNDIVYSKGITENKSFNTIISYNLPHDRNYIITIEIRNCFAYDEDGNITNVNDSIAKRNVKTKKLDLLLKYIIPKQHSIESKWQLTVSGVDKDKDDILGSPFNFVNAYAIPIKENGYQYNNVIEKEDGTTLYNYIPDHIIKNNNLTYYYCKYKIVVQATDGYNIITKTEFTHTIFPYCRLYINNKWIKAMPHIYTNNKWVPAPAFIYDEKFRECDGVN